MTLITQESKKLFQRTVESRESRVETKISQSPRREEIAAIVDKFLSQKLAAAPSENTKAVSHTETANQIPDLQPAVQNPPAESPVKTIIHELRNSNATNGVRPAPVDFVSEDDVRRAVERGEKIYVTAKTIITPSARDLGEEREIFART